jgi:probable DNA metabolism protein
LGESLSAGLLLELSVDAFDRFVYAWMSELPLEAEIIRFGWKVIRAARAAGEGAGQGRQSGHWAASAEARLGAEQAASDRGDPDVRAVLEAAYKVCREIDRLQGLLRFSPMDGGSGSPVYLARCCPDHYVLPGLSGHFTRRFGETSWVIADEKRNLALAREPGGEARLFPLASRCVGQSLAPGPENPGDSGVSGDHDQPRDYFEELWRNYHRSVNNPDRNNPALQRCFMPRRYWKYLPEVQ